MAKLLCSGGYNFRDGNQQNTEERVKCMQVMRRLKHAEKGARKTWRCRQWISRNQDV